MKIDVYGDALHLLEHFIHYSTTHPERMAQAMCCNPDGFNSRLRCLDKAFREGLDGEGPGKAGRVKKAQPPLPGDFDNRFPGYLGEMAREWLAYKTERRDFYTPTGLRNLLAQIENRASEYSDETVGHLISECMANNWAGIIWEKIAHTEHRASHRGNARRTHRASKQKGEWDDFPFDNGGYM